MVEGAVDHHFQASMSMLCSTATTAIRAGTDGLRALRRWDVAGRWVPAMRR
ncbi:hypothetical protein I546_7317 [Mycobacterium kansasii 732]|nr:hypothetical protein I546_7317 [Mycobacterium kansasii 732]